MSAIDAKMKFALTLNYKRITSKNMKDFYQRFKSVYPGTIKVWQSDNGSENLGEFDQELADWNIYYDCERRHHSLGLKSPINYLIENGGMSQKSLTYTNALQIPCLVLKYSHIPSWGLLFELIICQ